MVKKIDSLRRIDFRLTKGGKFCNLFKLAIRQLAEGIFKKYFGRIAQWLEHGAYNAGVDGSNPSASTRITTG